MSTTVLLLDDEEKLRQLLARIISLEGFEVIQAGDCRTGMKKLEQHTIDILVCDVKLPDGSGIDFSRSIKERFPLLEVILLTAYGTIPDSVQAIKNGAFDYLTKGDDNNRIIPLLYKAAEKAALSKRIHHLEKQLDKKYAFSSILGSSAAIQQAKVNAEKVAATDVTVLLNGETGTGKEVFAQAIHNGSKRCRQPFVAVNCAAFSRELLENELFGHKAGAFTGALKDSRGLFEEAQGGTLFLDEIGEMPVDLQAKLLRVLETGEFLKIGDSKPTRVNVRIIAATNRQLLDEIEKGNFREDLYYRISVFTIHLPSLKDRISDISELTEFFTTLFAKKAGRKTISVSAAYLQALKQHNWKGNIRELKNVIERSVILSDGSSLMPESLPGDFTASYSEKNQQLSAFDLASAEKIHIQKVMNHTQGNKTEAARLLNIALTTLYRKLEEYKIS